MRSHRRQTVQLLLYTFTRDAMCVYAEAETRKQMSFLASRIRNVVILTSKLLRVAQFIGTRAREWQRIQKKIMANRR